MRVSAVGVVVPVHDEAELLPRCLTALAAAIAGCEVPVHVVLVLDACSDASAEIATLALPPTSTVLTADLRCVGAARSLGCQTLVERLGVDGVWLATTDADSAVDPTWLAGSVHYAERGYDVVAGTVTVDDWTPHPADVRTAYLAGYQPRWGHRHVHGANLAVAAEAYLAAGGFEPVGCHEDARLVAALAAAGRRIAWADDLPVVTSARPSGRTPGGFSGFLRDLLSPPADPEPGQLDEAARASLILTRPPLRSSAPA